MALRSGPGGSCGSQLSADPLGSEMLSLDTIEKALGALSDAATVAAIVVGGFWTYFLFIKYRQRYPRIAITLHAEVAQLPPASSLIQVSVSLQNSGAVLLQPRAAEVRARQVLPLPPELVPVLTEGLDPVTQGEAIYSWPLIAQRQWTWNAGDFDLEPGESECLMADFMLPATIEVVQLYAFVQNPNKPSGIGWTHSQLIRIGDEMSDKQTSREVAKQQRQQRQQKPQQSQQSTQRPAQQGGSQQGGGGNQKSGGQSG